MNRTQILSSLKSKDLNALKGFSEQACREKQEAFIPLLIYCIQFSDDNVIKRNLLRLMSLYHKKYLSHIEKFTEDKDPDVSQLAKKIMDSKDDIPYQIQDPSSDESNNTATTKLYQALNQDCIDDMTKLISELKEDLKNWNEVQRQEVIDFLVPRCFGLRSNLSEIYKTYLLDLLVYLEPVNLKESYLSLLENPSYGMFRWGVVGLGNYKSDLLNTEWEKLIHSYQGSVAQRNLLKMYLEASREIPFLHKKWLAEIVDKFEDDKVLIKEIAEAYQWKIEDTVPQLLSWFNQVKNDDLKFRIIRSLDSLLKPKHIQFLRNTIQITHTERDLQILNNLLLSLESKINNKNQKKVSLEQSSSNKNSSLSDVKQHYLYLGLSFTSICITLLILLKQIPIKTSSINKELLESQIVSNNTSNMNQCNAHIINLDPVIIHCEGLVISVLNASNVWQKYWLGETVKVNLTQLTSSKKNSMSYKANVNLIDEIQVVEKLPMIGRKLN